MNIIKNITTTSTNTVSNFLIQKLSIFVFAIVLTFAFNNEVKAQCPSDEFDGPYWTYDIPHPFAHSPDCDVSIQWCVRHRADGTVDIHIVSLQLRSPNCAGEAAIELNMNKLISHFLKILLEEEGVRIPRCGAGEYYENITVIFDQCMSEIHYDPDYENADPSWVGYVIKPCNDDGIHCYIPTRICIDEFDNIIVEGISIFPPDESGEFCGYTETSYGERIRCFTICPR